MQFLMSLIFLWGCHGDVASLCFWDCMLHVVYRIFKVYLRTLNIERRLYRRKRNLLNLPYSPMIIICSLSTVVTCVKRSQIWSNGYCLCYMFHVVCFFSFLFSFFFFLIVSSFQLNFNFFNHQPWHRILSVAMCYVVMTSVFSWYFTMEWNADWVLRVYVDFFLCVCVHFLHRCQYCHTRFNALVWLRVNIYFISHRHIILL